MLPQKKKKKSISYHKILHFIFLRRWDHRTFPCFLFAPTFMNTLVISKKQCMRTANNQYVSPKMIQSHEDICELSDRDVHHPIDCWVINLPFVLLQSSIHIHWFLPQPHLWSHPWCFHNIMCVDNDIKTTRVFTNATTKAALAVHVVLTCSLNPFSIYNALAWFFLFLNYKHKTTNHCFLCGSFGVCFFSLSISKNSIWNGKQVKYVKTFLKYFFFA